MKFKFKVAIKVKIIALKHKSLRIRTEWVIINKNVQKIKWKHIEYKQRTFQLTMNTEQILRRSHPGQISPSTVRTQRGGIPLPVVAATSVLVCLFVCQRIAATGTNWGEMGGGGGEEGGGSVGGDRKCHEIAWRHKLGHVEKSCQVLSFYFSFYFHRHYDIRQNIYFI